MDRRQENSNKKRKAVIEYDSTNEKATQNQRGARQNTAKKQAISRSQGKTSNNMATPAVNVVIQRTFVTPRGRKFPPRAVREFQLDPVDNLSATIREKIVQLFPKLPGQFSVLTKGADGELVPVDGDGQIVEALNSSQDRTLKLFVQGECPMHQNKVMEPVTCSSCHGEVTGTRTKCLQCPDYNLCVGCDESGIHGDHVMVRSDRPMFFKMALTRFSNAIPALCEKHLAENSGSEPLPRLAPQDVRVFWQSQHKGHGQGKPQGQGHHGPHQQHMHQMWRMFLTRIADGNKAPETEMGEGKALEKPRGQWKMAEPRKCSGCEVAISGRRTKCLQCPDYNLCEACDKQQLHGHHVMVTGERPRFFHFALPMFRDIIPLLCEKHVSENQDKEHLPRLMARDVRQYWQSQRKRSCPDQTSPGMQSHNCHPMKRMVRMWRPGGPGQWGKACGRETEKDDEGRSTESIEEIEEKSNAPASGKERQKRIQQMKRQWIQKSVVQWREQLQKMHEAEGASKPGDSKPPMALWRPYMRQCWDQWQSSMTDAGLTADDLPGPKAKQTDENTKKTIHPRRQWIENCWKIWREEASKTNQGTSIDGDAMEQVSTGPRRGPHGRPFPPYWMMMQRNWRLMMEQMRSQTQQTETTGDETKEKTIDGENADEKATPNIEPQVAKQMLKRCWVNGCRQLWWMHVKKELGEEAALITGDVEMAKAMSEHNKWKAYMQDCWKLWKQLSNQSGLSIKPAANEEADMDADEGGNATKPPKQQWLKDSWALWKDKMSAQIGKKVTEDESTKQQQRQPNNMRPFPGWHPLIIESWKMMQETLKTDQVADQAAWMKVVGRKMKKLSLEKDNQKTLSSELQAESSKMEVVPSSDYDTARTQLPKQLMEQYWNMMKAYQSSGASRAEGSPQCWRQGWRQWKKPCMAAARNCRGGRGRQGPRLRMTLSMRPQPQQPHQPSDM